MTPCAEADNAKVLVERARPANVEALDEGEAGAIDDAERLIGPFLRNLATAPKILCRGVHHGQHVERETIPEAHGRPASEP